MADATDVVVVVAVVALAPVAVPAPAPALAPALAVAVALASSHALSCLTISNPYVNEAPAPNGDLAGALLFQLECETKSDT
ncbi:hypothetical protein ODZ53_22210 [Brevibacillus sp. BD137]